MKVSSTKLIQLIEQPLKFYAKIEHNLSKNTA